jgi:hypothetical protein
MDIIVLFYDLTRIIFWTISFLKNVTYNLLYAHFYFNRRAVYSLTYLLPIRIYYCYIAIFFDIFLILRRFLTISTHVPDGGQSQNVWRGKMCVQKGFVSYIFRFGFAKPNVV